MAWANSFPIPTGSLQTNKYNLHCTSLHPLQKQKPDAMQPNKDVWLPGLNQAFGIRRRSHLFHVLMPVWTRLPHHDVACCSNLGGMRVNIKQTVAGMLDCVKGWHNAGLTNFTRALTKNNRAVFKKALDLLLSTSLVNQYEYLNELLFLSERDCPQVVTPLYQYVLNLQSRHPNVTNVVWALREWMEFNGMKRNENDYYKRYVDPGEDVAEYIRYHVTYEQEEMIGYVLTTTFENTNGAPVSAQEALAMLLLNPGRAKVWLPGLNEDFAVTETCLISSFSNVFRDTLELSFARDVMRMLGMEDCGPECEHVKDRLKYVTWCLSEVKKTSPAARKLFLEQALTTHEGLGDQLMRAIQRLKPINAQQFQAQVTEYPNKHAFGRHSPLKAAVEEFESRYPENYVIKKLMLGVELSDKLSYKDWTEAKAKGQSLIELVQEVYTYEQLERFGYTLTHVLPCLAEYVYACKVSVRDLPLAIIKIRTSPNPYLTVVKKKTEKPLQ